MSSDVKEWSDLPKTVRLLDISTAGFIIILAIAGVLFLGFLDQTVQNAILIFLTALLLLFTWHFRTQLVNTTDPVAKKQLFRKWVLLCVLTIVVVLVLVFVYPVTY